MDKSTARATLYQYRPISGEVSRYILWAIQHDLAIDPALLPNYISLNQIERLRVAYKQKLNSLENTLDLPRNYIFYQLIQERFPSFSWGYSEKKMRVVIDAPRLGNMDISLLSLLIGDFPFEGHSALSRRYPGLKNTPEFIVDALNTLFKEIYAIYPSESNILSMIGWLNRGLAGETLHLFSLACPDYSVEKNPNSEFRFIHTFKSLGSGIGLVARRILNAIPIIDQMMKRLNIKIIYTLAMADYEVLSHTTLERLNLNAQEFLKKIEASRKAFQKACPIVHIETPMMSEICGGYEEWKKLTGYFRAQFSEGNFGKTNLTQNDLLNILETRKDFYARWYGARSTMKDYLDILLDQGSEYSAVGSLLLKRFSNCFVLGADHSPLAPFYSFNGFVPSLYLKRFYL